MSKLDYMDTLGRLAAPADQAGLERFEVAHGVPVRAAAEVHPHVRTSGVSVQVLGETSFRTVIKGPAPIDQAGIGNEAVTFPDCDDGQGLVLERPPRPQVVIPVDPFNPFTLGFDSVSKPGKMRKCRIS